MFIPEESVVEEVATSTEEVTTEPTLETPAEGTEPTGEPITEPIVDPVEAVAKPTQSAEDNAKFADIRRKYEGQTNMLINALKAYGYEGTPEEIADKLLSESEGITPDEAKARREQEEALEEERKTAQSEIQMYKSIAIEKLMADDLKKIQDVYPEVKNLEDLGEDFIKALNATDRDPLIAYEVLMAKKARETKTPPAEIGAVNRSTGKEKDFYTPDEVDKLTGKDYDDPKLMERVRQSMLKWK